MNEQASNDWFTNVDAVVAEPLKFKAKLGIGENAYTSLRAKNAAFEAWNTLGTATATAAAAAHSSVVASTFFAPSGFLGMIGIGTAVTPIGWVVAAGVVSGGAWLGITSYLKSATNNRVTVIPEFINTPIDVLGLGLFDLIAPLSLKLAAIDGNIDKSEYELITNYFINEWGYDQNFVDKGLNFIESRLSDFSIKEVARALAEFKIKNPDCNYKPMSQEIIGFLRSIMEADGVIDEREEMAIDAVKKIFKETGKFSLTQTVKKRIGAMKFKPSKEGIRPIDIAQHNLKRIFSRKVK
jgi:hypothetical protein